MAADLSRRLIATEWMDGPDVDFQTFHDCLVDLAKVNRLTLAYRPTLAFLERLDAQGLWPRDRPLHVLDVGSGYGDMLRKIAAWAAERGLEVKLTGLDINPFAARAAEQASGSGAIRFVTGDLRDYRGWVDVAISSLFTHHLDENPLIRFLEWQESTAHIGWFINDLQRHTLSYRGFALLSGLMRWHRFVRHDGPISIARAFRPEDWSRLLAAAGVHGARIEPRFPFRLCVAKARA